MTPNQHNLKPEKFFRQRILFFPANRLGNLRKTKRRVKKEDLEWERGRERKRKFDCRIMVVLAS